MKQFIIFTLLALALAVNSDYMMATTNDKSVQEAQIAKNKEKASQLAKAMNKDTVTPTSGMTDDQAKQLAKTQAIVSEIYEAISSAAQQLQEKNIDMQPEVRVAKAKSSADMKLIDEMMNIKQNQQADQLPMATQSDIAKYASKLQNEAAFASRKVSNPTREQFRQDAADYQAASVARMKGQLDNINKSLLTIQARIQPDMF